MTMLDTRDLETFRSRIDDLVRRHPVVTDNAYTRWFATGQATAAEPAGPAGPARTGPAQAAPPKPSPPKLSPP